MDVDFLVQQVVAVEREGVVGFADAVFVADACIDQVVAARGIFGHGYGIQAASAAFLRLLLRAEYAFQPACDWGVVELDAGVQPFVGKHGVGATFAWAAVSALRRCLSSG